jgi:hypothetical protein
MNVTCISGSRAVQIGAARVRILRLCIFSSPKDKRVMRTGRVAAVAMLPLMFVSVPAQADGFSFTYVPRGEEAEVIRNGMMIYGVARDLRNRAKTRQRGSANGAAIAQSGRGNNAFIVQRGRGNSGSIQQNGNYNSYGLIQFGQGNSRQVVQNGDGQVGFTIQGNW